jgi:hypothetical protein
MVTVQTGFRTRDLSISCPTRLPTALTGPTRTLAWSPTPMTMTSTLFSCSCCACLISSAWSWPPRVLGPSVTRISTLGLSGRSPCPYSNSNSNSNTLFKVEQFQHQQYWPLLVAHGKGRKLRYDMTNFVWNRPFWCRVFITLRCQFFEKKMWSE